MNLNFNLNFAFLPFLRLNGSVRVALLLFLFTSLTWAASEEVTPESTARLVRVDGVWHNADEIVLGVEFTLKPEWHVYWKNPGEAGAAPKFKYEVTNTSLLSQLWPVPERFVTSGLHNYGYKERVVFPTKFAAPADNKKRIVNLALEWLNCKIECVPHFAKLSGEVDSLPVVQLSPRYPLPLLKSSISKTQSIDDNGVQFEISIPHMPLGEFDFFPADPSTFSAAAPNARRENDTIKIQVPWAANADRTLKTIPFLAVFRGDETIGYETTLSLEIPMTAEFWKALSLAFFGGILLNLMPCVFPVLSIKILSFAGSGNSKKKVRTAGIMYSLGVMVSFLALGAVLLVLRLQGEQLGWGFQLQYPPFVFGLALLFFLIGLNFLGSFEVGYSIMNFGGRLMSKKGFQSAFGTGVLATVAATPCTAPFMGSALGLSLLLPPFQSLLVFGSLGFGMALPFLLLCEIPGLVDSLPKPGVWMEKLKEFFAFPMFFTAVWLGWVLIQQTGPDGFVVLGCAFVGIAFGQWFLRNSKKWPGLKTAGLFVLISSVVLPTYLLHGAKAERSAGTHASWQPYDAKKISEAVKSGQPVFVDFTASWCITCQVNKKAVLETEAAQSIFKKNNVLLIEADWTNADAEVTKALEKYGRNSVPLYVFLSGGKEKILPELLTMKDIETLF